MKVVGYHLNLLDEPVFIAMSKPLLTEFGIHLRLESCRLFYSISILQFNSRGECFALKSGDNYEIRDLKCNREIGFICEWTSEVFKICKQFPIKYLVAFISQNPHVHLEAMTMEVP